MEPEPVKPNILRMRRADLIKEVQEERKKNEVMAMRSEQLAADFKRDLNVAIKRNQELNTERDSLLQQMQEVQNQQQLQQFVVKIQEMTTERDSLLHQLQQEMSKSEGLGHQLMEFQQSHQSIVDAVVEQNNIRVQEMSEKLIELTNQCRVLNDEKRNLTEKLDQINEENTCAICLSPWEAQGDHRIVSLPCGHLFGKQCIRDHLARNSECPLCKQVVQSGDMRNIFGSRIRADV